MKKSEWDAHDGQQIWERIRKKGKSLVITPGFEDRKIIEYKGNGAKASENEVEDEPDDSDLD